MHFSHGSNRTGGSFGPDDLLGSGDADEIPSSHNLHLLRRNVGFLGRHRHLVSLGKIGSRFSTGLAYPWKPMDAGRPHILDGAICHRACSLWRRTIISEPRAGDIQAPPSWRGALDRQRAFSFFHRKAYCLHGVWGAEQGGRQAAKRLLRGRGRPNSF